MSEAKLVSIDEGKEKESDYEEVGTNEVEESSFKCEYCGIVYQKYTKYMRHIRTHTKEV